MEFYYILGGIIIVIVTILITAKLNAKFRKIAYKLFLYAENNLTEEKMEYCVEKIYTYLPLPLKILPASFYRFLLQLAFDEIKDLLDDGKINNSSEIEIEENNEIIYEEEEE